MSFWKQKAITKFWWFYKTDEKFLFLPSWFVVIGRNKKISENQRENEIWCKFYDLFIKIKINLLSSDS